MDKNTTKKRQLVWEEQSYAGILLFIVILSLASIPLMYLFFFFLDLTTLFNQLIFQILVIVLLLDLVLSLVIPHKSIAFDKESLKTSYIHTLFFILTLPALIILFLGMRFILVTFEDLVFHHATKIEFINLGLNTFSLTTSLQIWSFEISKLWELIFGPDSSQCLKIARANKERNGTSTKLKDPYLLSQRSIESLIQEYNNKNP